MRTLLLALFLACVCPAWAEEGREPSLAGLVEEFERTEQEMEQAKAELASSASAAQRGRLKKQMEELRARQAGLIEELERAAGPLPPAVRDEALSPAEEKLDSRRLRDDAILEKDVERRLP